MTKNTSKIHLDLLDKTRQIVLKKLAPLTKGFVLGGGTALALQLAHRLSFDFDFFSPYQIPKDLLEKLSKIFSIENIVIDTLDELTFFTKENVKITFLHYPFKQLFASITLHDGLSVFSVEEIALQKAYTIGRRGEYRDYFDLYTILKTEFINLEQILTGAKRVYNGAFDEKLFLEQLVYFGDITNFEVIPVSNESTHDLTVRVSSLDRTKSDVGKPTTSQSGFYRDKPLPTSAKVKEFFEKLVKTHLQQ